MKKFAGLLISVVMLITMLTVFVVPASAEEEKTADDYMTAGAALQLEGRYEDAADAYMKAASLYEDADDPDSAAEVYLYIGNMFTEVANLYWGAGNSVAAADAFMKAGEGYEKAGEFSSAANAFIYAASMYNYAEDDASAAEAYIKSGKCYEKANDLSNAKSAFDLAALAAQDKADKLGRSTGSTLSEGSLTIIVGVAAAVVFGLGGFILGTKKKKKPAVASGTDEE